MGTTRKERSPSIKIVNDLPPIAKEIRLSELQRLAALGFTLQQIALIMNVGLRTLELKIHDIPEVKYAWDTGRHQGLEKIAKSAFEGAMEGDTTLIIFLCKTRLHWSEKPEATSDSKQINIYLPEALSEEKWNERIRNSNGTKISAQEETTG